MHPLLLTLSQWPGRQITRAVLERRGYWMPTRFEEVVSTACADPGALERYWNEVAMEYICSAGRAHSNRRAILETSYRSEYLDKLATERRKENGRDLDGLPLDTCLRDFKVLARSSFRNGLPYLEWLENEMRSHKQDEMHGFQLSAHAWTGTKRDFYDALGTICERKYFKFRKQKWRKDFGSLEVCCRVDVAMQRTWTFQLPLEMKIIDKLNPDLTFNFALGDQVAPCFHYYTRDDQHDGGRRYAYSRGSCSGGENSSCISER